MAQFPTPFGGSLDIWAITVEERAKHDQQFHSLKPISGFITGDQARNFFLQSGLPQPVLAQIWALADMNSDGRMDQVEFSIAMKLIKLKLQGCQLPCALPPVMKQQPVAISSAPAFDGTDGPTGCCSGDADTVASIPSGAHPVARAPEASWSLSKSTVPLTQRPGNRHHRFVLIVPFPTSLEAEIACGSLAPDVELHLGLVGKELKVSGSMLEVHWIAEDSRLLRISIMNFLDQLSIVVNTIQRFGPPVSR